MCGRYANFLSDQELRDAFALAVIADDARLLGPSWNIAPTQRALIVTPRRDHDSERAGESARWGLVPSWARDVSVGSKTFNARSETVADKPSFRSAFAKRRCLVPANGYFEWHTANGVKRPYFIHDAAHSPLAVAGLYEVWRDKAAGPEAPAVVSFTILTTAARDALRELHDRQPVMLAPDAWDTWLDPASAAPTLHDAIAAPAPPLAWPAVDGAVGNVRANRPDLVEPVDAS